MPYDLITNNNINRDIKYINRDFSDFRTSLIEFAKTYFPNVITDFSPTSPGTLFIEMASYVGDVLSFYLDNQIQENFIQYAKQFNNLYSLAYMMGYKPKISTAANVELDVFQTVPAIYNETLDQNVPDYRYALVIAENSVVANTTVPSVPFLIQDRVDFTQSSSYDPTTISVYEIEGDQPKSFLLRKTTKAISATINTTTLSVGDATKYYTHNFLLQRPLGILDITDSDGNEWIEVDYLAQETIFEKIENTNEEDENSVPYVLRLKKVPRRFISRFLNSNNLNSGSATLQIQFGAGTTGDYDEQIIPNPDNVGIGLPDINESKLYTAYSPSNFMFTKTYGIVPSNTTLTVRYLTGGGVESNIPENSLTSITTTNNISFNIDTNSLDPVLVTETLDSLITNNPTAATGGSNGDSVQDIRINSLASYASQLRSVTKEDYLVRALSLPSIYGSLAKVHAEIPQLDSLTSGEAPSVLDLYVLAYDIDKKLTTASSTLKQNLSTYLSEYRMINDTVRIKDAYVINIGIKFEIVVLPNYNNNQVLTNCIAKLREYFNTDNQQINKPIFLNELYILLNSINGVQIVKDIYLTNKVGESSGYSRYGYDLKGATKNGVVYPSKDPSIFEVKYPNNDIKGRVVPL